jgi:hypothetical protein
MYTHLKYVCDFNSYVTVIANFSELQYCLFRGGGGGGGSSSSSSSSSSSNVEVSTLIFIVT